MEIRLKTLDIECLDDKSYKIGGYVNVTERESELLYSNKRNRWFNEVVKQGAFKRSLSSGKDIPLLLEHDYEKRLADTSGTLILTEDQIGLRFDAEIRDKDVYEKIKSKQINNCSFGFLPIEQEFEAVTDLREKRYLKDLELLEVSLVENPAYAGSLVEVRNMNEEMKKNEETAKEKALKDTENSEKEVEESIENKEEADKTEVASSENKKEEEKEEEAIEEKDEQRGYIEDQIEAVVEQIEKEEVINEIIAEKEEQLGHAEYIEEAIKDDLEDIKNYNKEFENMIESEAARASLEVLKLRVQLMKLKSI